MLYSHSHQDRLFDYFASFVENVLRGDVRYRKLVEPVILDAKSLANREKDYYGINRSQFDVIVYLAQKAPDFLQHLDTDHLSTEDYKKILEIVTSHKDVVFA